MPPSRPAAAGNRITLFVPLLVGGGAERVMVNLAGAFAECGLATDLVLVRAEGPYLEDVPPAVRTVDLRARRLLTSLPALVRYLRRARPTAMLSTIRGANVLAPLARWLAGRGKATRLVVREPNTLTAARHGHLPAYERALLALMRHAYPRADAVIANSRDTARDLVRHGVASRSRICVLPNPLVTPSLFEQAKAEVALHPWLSDSTAAPVVLGAGRLVAQKGFAMLIEAFARLRTERAARLIILGEGPERAALERLARERGVAEDVDLPGFVENPYAFMRHAAVFALSSLWEGFGNVLVETLAMGTPVVATRCPGGPREILAGGAFGRLVPVGDAEAMARALAATLDAPPEADRLRARAADFSVERVAAQYLDVLLP